MIIVQYCLKVRFVVASIGSAYSSHSWSCRCSCRRCSNRRCHCCCCCLYVSSSLQVGEE